MPLYAFGGDAANAQNEQGQLFGADAHPIHDPPGQHAAGSLGEEVVEHPSFAFVHTGHILLQQRIGAFVADLKGFRHQIGIAVFAAQREKPVLLPVSIAEHFLQKGLQFHLSL